MPTPGVNDYERYSWRWNDPSALAFDLDRARESRREADAIGSAAALLSGLNTVTGALQESSRGRPLPGILARALPRPVTLGAVAANQAATWEKVNRDKEIAQLQARLRELGVAPQE